MYKGIQIGVLIGNNYGTIQDIYNEIKTDNGTKEFSNGYYSTKGYFCILTKERTPEEIARTTFHEMAHYFEYEQPEHFSYGGTR